jgi:hypothetical protein
MRSRSNKQFQIKTAKESIMNRIEHPRRLQSVMWITTVFIFAIVFCGQAGAVMAQTNTFPTSGNVGVGTTTPSQPLHVSGYDTTGAGVFAEVENTATTGQPAAGIFFMVGGVNKGSFGGVAFTNPYYGLVPGLSLGAGNPTDSIFFRTGSSITGTATGPQMIINSAGNVGIGLTTPAYRLDVAGQVRSGSGGFVFPDGTVQTTAATGTGGGSSQWTTSGSNIFYNAGNVGIGINPAPQYKLDVAGDVRVSGNIAAKYQDVAEWVEASHLLPAGTVVVLNPAKSNQVMASTQAYDTRVAGVISTQPGIALGESGEGKVLVATTGRVKVKVDATRSPIHIGDLLVTGEREGVAIRSEPLIISGRQFHSPGTLIGKALEPLAKGTGEILVLLSLQ